MGLKRQQQTQRAVGESWQARGTVNQAPVEQWERAGRPTGQSTKRLSPGLGGCGRRTGLVPVASWKGELGKSAHRWQADADASPSPGAASFLASPLRSWLCVSGSEVLPEEAGLHPKMLSATQISCLKKRVPAAHLPASSLLPLSPPPFPPLPSPPLPSSFLPSFLPSYSCSIFPFLLPRTVMEPLPSPDPKQVLERKR